MDTFGRHLLAEYRGCSADFLDDAPAVEALLREAADAAGATVVQVVLHRFAPQGVSGVVVVEESHLSIHTWPERGYAAVDFYSCGDCSAEAAHAVLEAAFGPESAELMIVERGRGGPQGMRVARHDTRAPRREAG